jgi:hypothetical protein
VRIPRRAAGAFALLVAASAITCFGPTEVRIEVASDVPCAQIGHVHIEVGADDGSPPASVTDDTVCTDGVPTELGSLVVVPSGARDARVRIRVVVALEGKSIEACSAGPDLSDCIVATRVHHFAKHRSATLPIVVASACIGIRCDANQTCLDGRCTSADTTDPDLCGASGACASGDAAADGPADATPDVATDAGNPPCRFSDGAASLSDVARPFRLFVTPIALYVLQPGAGGAADLLRMRRERNTFELIASGVATAAASATHEFWVPLSGGILSRPAGSTAPATKLSDIPANPLVAEADHVFGIVGEAQGEAFYAFLPTGAVRLGAGEPFEYFSSFAVGEDRLLFGETSSSIRSLPKDASADAAVVVSLSPGTNVQQILADRPGNDVYFTQGPLALERYAGGVLTNLATPGATFSFQLDATDVYWLEPNGSGKQRLMRVPKAGGATTVRLPALETNAVFAIDDRCLYWWDGVTTGILSVEPK